MLATPSLGGTILPGVTRDSILALAAALGEFDVEERGVTLGEVRQAAGEGRLLEAFGSGTACIVQPVGALVRWVGWGGWYGGVGWGLRLRGWEGEFP